MNYMQSLDAFAHIGTFYNKHYLNQWVKEYNGFFNGGCLTDGFIDAMRSLKDDIYSSISKEYWPHITSRFLGCALNKSGGYSHDAIVIFTVVSVEANLIGVDKSYSAQQKIKASHGGVRDGAGRKKKEPSLQVRLPESIAGLVYGIRDAYDSQSEQGKIAIIRELEIVLAIAKSRVDSSEDEDNV